MNSHTHLGRAVDMESRREKHKEQSQTEPTPSVLSGSAEGAVFIRTQVGSATTLKEHSKEFIKVTVL